MLYDLNASRVLEVVAVGTTLPNAAVVHDKFHIVSYLTTMVDEVRRKENKTLRAAGIDDLVGSRYTWLRNPDK